MTIMKEKLVQILWEKNSPIWEMIIKNIDIFDENELHQIYLIIHQTDIEKLKELFLYQNSQAKALLDRVINIAREIHQTEKIVENVEIKQESKTLASITFKNYFSSWNCTFSWYSSYKCQGGFNESYLTRRTKRKVSFDSWRYRKL